MTLPLINQFLKPLEIYQTRPATQDDYTQRLADGWHISQCMQPVKLNLLDTIDTADKSAKYIFQRQNNVALENCIEKSLNNIHSQHSKSRAFMPGVTPNILSVYQRKYPAKIDMLAVDGAIDQGDLLADNQILFHGGAILQNISVGSSLITTRPLSTSLCPVKAFANGSWHSKYFNEKEASLIILTVKSMSKKAFIFRINGTDKGHEKEILISSGASLTVTSRVTLGQSFSVFGMGSIAGQTLEKHCPFTVTHAVIS